MKILILTVTDERAGRDGEGDISPHVEKIFLHHYPDFRIERDTVACGGDSIRDMFEKNADSDYIITLGCSGISDNDVVPDITARYCDRLLPGVAELFRAEFSKHTPYAALMRGVAGVHNRTIIVNFPGSLKAALLCARTLIPLIVHASDLLHGKKRESFEPGFMGLNAK